MKTRACPAWLRVAVLVGPFLLAGCGPRTHVAPASRPGEDAFDVITSFRIRHGVVSNRTTRPLPANAYRFPLFVPPNPGRRPLPGPHAKLHPELRRRLSFGPSAATEDVYVTFADTLHVPRFPTLGPWTGFSSGDSSSKHASTDSVLSVLRGRRSAQKSLDSALVVSRFGATVLDASFVLTRSMVLRVARDSLPSLARLPAVVYVRPAGPVEPPPQMNSATSDDPSRVRAWVGADPYAGLLPSGRLALLDTGVDSEHEMFASAALLGERNDMVNLTATGLPASFGVGTDEDLSPAPGHGTMSAGIMIGRPPAYDAGRGLTQIPIDFYRVYAKTPSTSANAQPGLVGQAVEKALLESLESFGGIVTIEVQAEDPDYGGIALAADQAFDGGAVVVAANGNVDEGAARPEVRSPANARRVLGIGAYSVRSGETLEEQIQRYALDGRVKPDIQMPSDYETGCKGPGTNEYGGHGGTSGATAVAGAAAALMRQILVDASGSVDPGFVYAGMIAGGDASAPFDEITGGGRPLLPDNCRVWTLKSSLSSHEELPVELDASSEGLVSVSAAIWWPERFSAIDGVAQDTHSQIGLTLEVTDAYGSRTATSSDPESVFQRATLATAAPVTKLVVRLAAGTVLSGPQTLYLVVFGQRAPGP